MSTLNGICMITDLMSSRTIGQFPLSIATSLAMEAAFGIYPDRPETKEPILKYDTLWVNVRTIFRNIMPSAFSVGKIYVMRIGLDFSFL